MIKYLADKKDHQFDNSKIEDFSRCPAYFYWKHIRRLESIYPNIHLLFGTAFHEAAAAYIRFLIQYRNYQQAYQQGMNTLVEFMTAVPEDPYGQKNLAVAEILFKKLTYVPEIYGEVLAIEKPMSMKLTPELEYFGKPDLMVKREGLKVIIDYKTKSRVLKNMSLWMYLSRQLRGYLIMSGADEICPIVLHCLKPNKKDASKGPKVIVNQYYIPSDERQRWMVATRRKVTMIYNRIKAVRTGTGSVTELFPKEGYKCQDWSCEFLNLCAYDCEPEKVPTDYQFYREY